MSAQDNLHPDEFMIPMQKILGLTSRDDDRGRTVGDVLPEKRGDLHGRYYKSLRSSMETQGQTAPIGVRGDELREGHHRVAIAQDLGWKEMWATSGRFSTTDYSWDQRNG